MACDDPTIGECDSTLRGVVKLKGLKIVEKQELAATSIFLKHDIF